MTSDESLAASAEAYRDAIQRLEVLLAAWDAETWNQKLPQFDWTHAQVLDHLRVSMDSYMNLLPAAIQRAPQGGDRAVKSTLIGKFLIGAAGPGSSAPAPKIFAPRRGPFGPEIGATVLGQLRQLLALTEQARGRDTGSVKVPLAVGFGLLKITLGEALELHATHADRHVGQIEQRLAR